MVGVAGHGPGHPGVAADGESSLIRLDRGDRLDRRPVNRTDAIKHRVPATGVGAPGPGKVGRRAPGLLAGGHLLIADDPWRAAVLRRPPPVTAKPCSSPVRASKPNSIPRAGPFIRS